MKPIETKARKDNNGKKIIIVEIDEDDSIILEQALQNLLDEGKFDKDDHKKVAKINHVKENIHETWRLLHPS